MLQRRYENRIATAAVRPRQCGKGNATAAIRTLQCNRGQTSTGMEARQRHRGNETYVVDFGNGIRAMRQ
eukprot:2962900-Pyramimonas_sp.AAC.1